MSVKTDIFLLLVVIVNCINNISTCFGVLPNTVNTLNALHKPQVIIVKKTNCIDFIAKK